MPGGEDPVLAMQGRGFNPHWELDPTCHVMQKKVLKKEEERRTRGRESWLLAYFSGGEGLGGGPELRGAWVCSGVEYVQPGRGRVVSKGILSSAAAVIRWQTLISPPSHAGTQPCPSRRSTRLGGRTRPVEHKLHPDLAGQEAEAGLLSPSSWVLQD